MYNPQAEIKSRCVYTYGDTYTFYIVKNTTFFNQTQIIQSDDFDRQTGGSVDSQSLDDNMTENTRSDIHKFLPDSNILIYTSLSEDEFYYARISNENPTFTMSSVSFHDKHVSKDSTSKDRGNSFVKYSMFIDDTKVIMYKDEGTEFSDSTVYKVDSPEFWYHVDKNGGNVLIAWCAGNNPGATIRNLKVANYNPWVDGF